MDKFRVKEDCIVDLTEESGDEENSKIKKEKLTPHQDVLPETSIEDDVKDVHIKFQDESQSEEDSDEETSQIYSRLSPRNVEKILKKAVVEVKKGGALPILSLHYGLSEELIYQEIISTNATHPLDILTKTEEASLVKWILRQNKKNNLVMRKHLLERVGRMKKVSKISPIFSQSKFGKRWYMCFMKNNPEIFENDDLLLPADKNKQDTDKLKKLCNQKQLVVVLHDFMKERNVISNLSCKVNFPEKYNAMKNVKIEEQHFVQFSNSDLKKSDSDSKTSVDEVSEKKNHECIVKDISNFDKSIRKRLENNETVKRPTCAKCQKSFCNKTKLQRHLFTHLPKESYTLDCDKCSKRFPSRYHLLVHLKTTHSENVYKCSDCAKMFKYQTSLRNHFRNEHCTNENFELPRIFSCDYCKKSFKYKNSLEAHIMYGHLKEDKHHSCNVCNKRFIKRSLMIRHKTRHCKIKPLPCSNCEKRFSRKYLLNQHIEKCLEQNRKAVKDEFEKMSQEFVEEIMEDL